MSLNADQITACGERTFQLLTQAVRPFRQRTTTRGTALIQTYSPDHYSIQAAVQVRTIQQFYQEEMGYRMPYGLSALCSYDGSARRVVSRRHVLDPGHALSQRSLCDKSVTLDAALHVIGPAPPPVGKVKDMYRRGDLSEASESAEHCLRGSGTGWSNTWRSIPASGR